MFSMNDRLEMTHWTSAAVIEPDVDSREELKIRSGITVEGSSRNGAIFTLIEPDIVLRRSWAGAFEGEASCGATVMLIEPDTVLMESRS